MKTIVTFLCACLLFAACSETETASGKMTYSQAYEQISYAYVGKTGSDCQALLNAVIQGVNGLQADYNKSWDVNFSGPTMDEALADSDQQAAAGFDQAVARLKQWHETFEQQKAAKDYGKGYFEVVYRVRVWRMGREIRVSEPISFEYSTSTATAE